MDKNPIFAFLAGAAAGAVMALLFAPDKGSETRSKISRKAEEGLEAAKALKESLKESGNELKEDVRVRILERLEALERTLEKM